MTDISSFISINADYINNKSIVHIFFTYTAIEIIRDEYDILSVLSGKSIIQVQNEEDNSVVCEDELLNNITDFVVHEQMICELAAIYYVQQVLQLPAKNLHCTITEDFEVNVTIHLEDGVV